MPFFIPAVAPKVKGQDKTSGYPAPRVPGSAQRDAKRFVRNIACPSSHKVIACIEAAMQALVAIFVFRHGSPPALANAERTTIV